MPIEGDPDEAECEKEGEGQFVLPEPFIPFLPKMQKLLRRHEIDYEVLLCKNRKAHPLSGAWSTLVFVRRKQEVKGLPDKAAHVAPVRVRPKATLARHKRPHSILCETECPRG